MAHKLPKIVSEIRYIRDRARGIMGRLRIQSASYSEHKDVTSIAKAIAENSKMVHDVEHWIRRLGEPACGRIAAIGKGYPTWNEALEKFPFLKDSAPRSAWSGGWLPENGSGYLLLHHLATASLIGAMAVNIHDDLQEGEQK